MYCACPTCGSVVTDKDLPNMQAVAKVHDVLGLSQVSAIVFLQLWNSRGNTLTYDSIRDALQLFSDRDNFDLTAIKKRLSQGLQGYPVEVESVYGIGYRMVALDPDWTWHDVSV